MNNSKQILFALMLALSINCMAVNENIDLQNIDPQRVNPSMPLLNVKELRNSPIIKKMFDEPIWRFNKSWPSKGFVYINQHWKVSAYGDISEIIDKNGHIKRPSVLVNIAKMLLCRMSDKHPERISDQDPEKKQCDQIISAACLACEKINNTNALFYWFKYYDNKQDTHYECEDLANELKRYQHQNKK